MSELIPSDSGDTPDMLAGEFALGLLDGEERASAIRRVLADPGFAREVEAWRVRLAHLFDLWPEMTAPEILARIERSIDGAGAMTVATLPPRRPSKLWPGVAALSSIAAAGLLVILVTRPVPLPPTPAPSAPVAAPLPSLVASITPSAKGAPVTAVYDAGSGALRLTQADLADAKRSAELWVIPAGGVPHSLGLLQAHGGTALRLSAADRARIVAGATPAGLVVNHLLDPVPTEIHVFASYSLQMPLFVATRDKRLWRVEGAAISLAKPK